jgi:hypothetical protein
MYSCRLSILWKAVISSWSSNLTPADFFSSGVAKTFYCIEKGSNERESKNGACIIANVPPKISNQMSQTLHLLNLQFVPLYLMTDTAKRM